MGQIGSTMVSVCAIGNTSQQTVNAISNNNYDHNKLQPSGPRENCAVPNKKLFGPMVCHISLSKTLIPLNQVFHIGN